MAKWKKDKQSPKLRRLLDAVRRGYPDKNVVSMHLEGVEYHDTLFTFCLNEVNDVFDETSGFEENRREAIRAIGVAVDDLMSVVKSLEKA